MKVLRFRGTRTVVSVRLVREMFCVKNQVDVTLIKFLIYYCVAFCLFCFFCFGVPTIGLAQSFV